MQVEYCYIAERTNYLATITISISIIIITTTSVILVSVLIAMFVFMFMIMLVKKMMAFMRYGHDAWDGSDL